MSNWRCLVGLFLVLWLSSNAFAAVQNNTLDVDVAIKQLDFINQKISNQKINYSLLYLATNTIHALQVKADDCLTKSEAELVQIDALLKNIGASTATVLSKDDLYFQYLVKGRELAAKRLTVCGFIRLQSQETQKKMDEQLANFGVNEMLEKTPSLWRQFHPKLFSQVSINLQTLYHYSGVAQLNRAQRVVLPFIFFFGLFVAAFGFLWCNRLLNKKEKKWLPYSVLSLFKRYLPIILPLAFLSLFLHIALRYISPMPDNILLMDAFLFYSLALFVVNVYAVLVAAKRKWLDEQLAISLVRRVHVLLLLIFLGAVSVVLSRGQDIAPAVIDLMKAVYITLLTLSFLWVCWLVFQSHVFKANVVGLFFRLTQIFMLLVFATLVLLAWCGYEHLALFFIPNMIATIIVITLFFRVSSLLRHIYSIVSEPHQPISKKLRIIVGIKSEKKLIELFVIRVILNIAAGIVTLWALLEIWGVPNYFINAYFTSLMSGIHIFDVKVIPVRVMRGCVLFCVILLLGRAFATYVAHRHTFQKEADRQVAIATLITYVSFSVALLIGLLIAGVNLTGFAIVAGALSVGIGFGLQNLANDFVSGLILLVNQSVKPGDHVVIDTTEGYVKKIRILSTQVTTLDQADVMLPNSYLINKTIVNYTFRDNNLWKIKCQFILDNTKDVERAKQLMLEVAMKNKSVIQKESHQPVVLFEPTLFPSGFQFAVIDLWCTISDVNFKQIVASELNFAIVTAFVENNIKLKLNGL